MEMSYLRVSDVSWVPIVEKCGSGKNVFHVSVIRIFLKAYISWISIYSIYSIVFNKANYLIYIITLNNVDYVIPWSSRSIEVCLKLYSLECILEKEKLEDSPI